MAEDLPQFLAAQFARVQEWSLLCCRDLADEHLLAVPEGAGNHILWELGHICLSRNLLIVWGCGGREKLPEAWNTLFGFGSSPSARAADYPSFTEIQAELEAGGQAVADYIQTMAAADLDQPAPNLPGRVFPDRKSAFLHLLSHEAYHIGKISLLRKLQGLKTISELYFSE